jgi:hypothetical protein
LEDEFYDFPFSWGIVPPTDEFHHFSEGLKPPTRHMTGKKVRK